MGKRKRIHGWMDVYIRVRGVIEERQFVQEIG